MIRFNCDYSEGAHPKILKKLIETNLDQTPGYGLDEYCFKAADIIKNQCKDNDIDVHFLVGGTQVNLTVISAALRPHQGVISANTGHVNVHESGAIEATGHKVLSIDSLDGKLTASQVQDTYDSHFGDDTHEHMVQPKLVYISQPTELGSIYKKADLEAIYNVCKKNGLILYIDGARLGCALCAEDNDLTLADITKLCDAFYIGGTKNGLLFGEALVINNKALKEDFRYFMKQKGGLLAKGRLLGVQYLAAFEDNLFFEMADHADKMAKLIKDACIIKGYSFVTPSTTNQQFVIMPDSVLDKLNKDFEYAYIQRIDEKTSAVRFCTSWATNEEDVKKLVNAIEQA